MSAISLKSITGITSITTPAGVDNQLTLHNNNTTEAVKLDVAGNLHFHNHLNITGVSTASNFKTGTSNLHNTGLNVQDLDVDGHTNLDNVSVVGVTTITANNVIGLNVENSSGGGAQTTIRSKSTVANASNFVRSESSDNKYIGLLKYGTGHSAYGALAAGGGSVYANSSVPITIMSDGGSGYINFATGGNTERIRIDSSGRLLVGRTSTYASSSERLSVNGMTSIQGNSTSTAPLYVFNTDTTGSGTVQPFFYLHDGSGLRGGLGLQYSTANFIINAQNVLQFRTGSSGVGGTEKMRITTDKVMFSVDAKVDTTNTRDLGADGAKWKTLYLGTQLNIDAASSTEMIMLDVSGTNFAKIGHNSASGVAVLDVRSEGHTRFLTNGNNERLRIKSDGGILQTKTGGNANYTISRNESVGTTDQVIGVIDFASNTAHTTQSRLMGKTRGTSNVGGDLVVETRADGGSLDERIRFTSEGMTIKNCGAGGGIGINALTATSDYGLISANANRPSENDVILGISGDWNGDSVGGIYVRAGADTTNKDDGTLTFHTQTSGTSTLSERLRIKSDSSLLHTRTDNVGRYDLEFRNTGGISDGNYGGIRWSQSSTGGTSLAAIEIAYADSGRPDIVFKHRNRGGGTTFDEAMRIDRNAKIVINNSSPECRSGGIDMSSNVGTSGKAFTDLRGESQLVIRNPSTTQHSFTQLLFENGGGTSAATMFRHRLGSSQGSLQNFVGDMCLFRRTGNAGGSNADYRESTRWCGANEQALQVWWASGDSDTSNTNRLGWHHLSAQRDHPGTDAYSFFRLETGAASYARGGFGKYTCIWTTGHASGYGLATGHFGYYMHHGNSRIYVNEHIIYRERYSNGSYYGWDDAPNLRICNYTQSGGTNAAIVFRVGGRRYSGGYDMSVMVGLFIELYAPESANGDTNPRLYSAGNSQSNLDGGGFGSPVNHDYVTFQSSNPNHSGQP